MTVGTENPDYCARMADAIGEKLDEIDLISQIDDVGNLYDSTIKLVDFLRNCNGFRVAHGVSI